MMKKPKQFRTNYSLDNIDCDKLLKKVNVLIEGSVPKDFMAMIALATPHDNKLVFYSRWSLIPHDKNDYEIFDEYTQQSVYSNIALFSSALNIIYYLNKKITRACPVDEIIYDLDQEYYRCLDQIRFYQHKLKHTAKENIEMFAIKLVDRKHKLAEIKSRLSKIY